MQNAEQLNASQSQFLIHNFPSSYSKVNAQHHDGKNEADHPGEEASNHFDGLAVFVVVESESLEESRETVLQMEPDDGEKQQVADDDVQHLEFLAGLMVEVGLHRHAGGFEHGLVVFVEVGHPGAFGGIFAMRLGVGNGLRLRRLHRHDLFGVRHISPLRDAHLHEIKVHEMQQEAGEDEDARPDLEFGTRVSLGAIGFLVAHGPRHLVGDGQPKRQKYMQQQSGKQPHFEHFDDDVSAHEMAEGVVPLAAVVPQNEQVGTGVEQQKETQEGAQQRHKDFLGNGMDFGDVHKNIIRCGYFNSFLPSTSSNTHIC